MAVENQFNEREFEMFENEMRHVLEEEHEQLNPRLFRRFVVFANLVVFEPRARSGRNMMLLAARALACAKAIAFRENYGAGFHVSVCGIAARILHEQKERIPGVVELSVPLSDSMMAAWEALIEIINTSSTIAERMAAHRAAADFAVDIADCVDQAYKRRNRSVA
jgi:hypothetical protein